MKLFLFTTDNAFALRAQEAGVDSVIVDWESRGKRQRQSRYPLEVNQDTPEDVSRLAQRLTIPVTVRVNGFGLHTADEIECALDHGARILMLPMAQQPDEVEGFLKQVRHRVKTIVQIETQALVEQACALRDFAWDYAYIGLNDLMVSRGGWFLWDAVLDGTVERLFQALADRAVGLGGVTVVGGGLPVRFALLLHEMVRLGCQLSFLRRTFKKELMDRDFNAEIRAVRGFCEASAHRGEQAIIWDHQRFVEELLTLRRNNDFARHVQHSQAEWGTPLSVEGVT